MVRRRVMLAAIALVAAGVVASMVYGQLAAGTKAPGFTLPALDGKSFTLANCFKKPGKVVLLDIWATWCPPCRAEIPHLINLQKKLKGNDVLIVGVAIDQEKSTVTDFVKAQGINYTVVHDSKAAKIGSPYQVRTIPATYIIDRKGIIRYTHSGFPRDPEAGKREEANLEREIRTLLAQR